MSASLQPAQTTQRWTLKAGGQVITEFMRVDVDCDLDRVARSFDMTFFDHARQASDYFDSAAGNTQPLVPGMSVSIFVDGTAVLVGYIVSVDTAWSAEALTTRVTGLDKCGDLVECAAAPNGPAEWKNVDLLFVATQICKPYRIVPRADVSVGDPFVRLANGPHDTALAALEKASRQRSVLLVSDGVGGLMLTHGGSSRGPAPLRLGENVLASTAQRSWEHRFSDYYVKGQTEKCNGARVGKVVHLDSTVAPLSAGGSGPAPAAQIAPEASAILMTGHAVDPEITRYRPTVRLTRTQSGMSTTQEQAEWALRVARGQGDRLSYTVLDWRAPAGPKGTLWLPNQVVAVYDPVALINDDMLIAGVRYRYDEGGERTEMRVVGVTAYDRINEAAKRRPRSTKAKPGPGDATVAPLTAP